MLKHLVGIFLLFITSAVLGAPVKDWTFLIYINGNNNLHKAAVQNIKAMEQIGSDDRMNIVVQWADKKSSETARMLIQPSKDPHQVTSSMLQLSYFKDMGDYRTLQDFIQWGVTHYPARHYFIEVWDHGNGWHGPQLPLVMNLDISRDDFTQRMISTEQLGKVMKYAATLIGHKVDIYGSDACLMAMAEVADEMSDSVDFYVGSEESEPDTGWPYNDFLARWRASPHASPSDIVKMLVTSYVKAHENEDEITLSAYDLNQFPMLNNAIRHLAEEIRGLDANDKAAVLKTMEKVDRVSFKDYGDLLDFMKKLSAVAIPGLNPKSILAVQSAANQVIIASKSIHHVHATGMSIWLPFNYPFYRFFSGDYEGLQFNLHTQWGGTLKYLLKNHSTTGQ